MPRAPSKATHASRVLSVDTVILIILDRWHPEPLRSSELSEVLNSNGVFRLHAQDVDRKIRQMRKRGEIVGAGKVHTGHRPAIAYTITNRGRTLARTRQAAIDLLINGVAPGAVDGLLKPADAELVPLRDGGGAGRSGRSGYLDPDPEGDGYIPGDWGAFIDPEV